MKTQAGIALVDLDTVNEIEYEGHLITRIEPQYYFFVIRPIGKARRLHKLLEGKWSSAKEAIAAIDAAFRRARKEERHA